MDGRTPHVKIVFIFKPHNRGCFENGKWVNEVQAVLFLLLCHFEARQTHKDMSQSASSVSPMSSYAASHSWFLINNLHV